VVLLLRRGPLGTGVLVASMVCYPAVVACLHGVKQAPGRALDVLHSFAAGPWQQLIRVRIPTMLPAFFAAARMNVPASILAVTVVEWLATGKGIGSLMALSASLSDYDMLWSAVTIVAVLSALCYTAVGALEHGILRIYAPEQLQRPARPPSPCPATSTPSLAAIFMNAACLRGCGTWAVTCSIYSLGRHFRTPARQIWTTL